MTAMPAHLQPAMDPTWIQNRPRIGFTTWKLHGPASSNAAGWIRAGSSRLSMASNPTVPCRFSLRYIHTGEYTDPGPGVGGCTGGGLSATGVPEPEVCAAASTSGCIAGYGHQPMTPAVHKVIGFVGINCWGGSVVSRSTMCVWHWGRLGSKDCRATTLTRYTFKSNIETQEGKCFYISISYSSVAGNNSFRRSLYHVKLNWASTEIVNEAKAQSVLDLCYR